MKKIILLILLILFTFNLASCFFIPQDPGEYYYDYSELKDNVIKIELINYDNPYAKELFENRDKVIPFDFDKREIIEILSNDKIDDFLQEFSKLKFLMDWKHSDSPKGTSVRIVYENEDFIIISYNIDYSGSFYADGNVKEFIGELAWKEDFINLVNKYFDTQIDS